MQESRDGREGEGLVEAGVSEGKVIDSPVTMFSPLSKPVFRALWIAGVVSNVGSWVQFTGAGWLMAESTSQGLMVALIQSATALPVFFLSVPAGALADIGDRRKLLIGAQAWMFLVALALAILTYLDLASPMVLLLATFGIGLGVSMSGPALQAIVPELVTKREIPSAVALNSASMNLGRAVGPALGGLLVAMAGAEAAFFFNAASFLGLLAVLIIWRPAVTTTSLPAERLWGAMRVGVRYVQHSKVFRHLLLRASLFVVGGSSLWALLPMVAKSIPESGPATYGVFLGCLGAGAIVGLMVLPRLISNLGIRRTLAVGSVMFSMGCLGTAYATGMFAICACLVFSGAAWLLTLTRMNSAAQASAPRWVRARALAVYMLVFFGGMGLGSILWGIVVDQIGLSMTLTSAAVWLLISTMISWRLTLPDDSEDHDPSHHWPEPTTMSWVGQSGGHVVVTIEYHVDPEKVEEFLTAIRRLRQARLRSGATRWNVFRDAASQACFVEMFMEESWVEHLRHHDRVSHADRLLQEQVNAFPRGDQPPKVTHLLEPWQSSIPES